MGALWRHKESYSKNSHYSEGSIPDTLHLSSSPSECIFLVGDLLNCQLKSHCMLIQTTAAIIAGQDCWLLSSLEACMPLSGTEKQGIREEAVGAVPCQGPLSPRSEVHGVFSNRDLASISCGRPKAMPIACNVWEVS